MRNVDKKYHYLYKTTNNVNGKYYYGMHSTNDLNDEYLGSGKRLKYSIRKYGKENFNKEIIKFFDTRDALVQGEIDLITEEILNQHNCMNLMNGGSGGFVSVEVQFKRSKAGGKASAEKLKNDENYKLAFINRISNNMKERHKLKLVNYNTFEGKKHTEETKLKMSNSMKNKNLGENNGSYGTCWITNNIEDKKIKKEELEKYLSLGYIKGRIIKNKSKNEYSY